MLVLSIDWISFQAFILFVVRGFWLAAETCVCQQKLGATLQQLAHLQMIG